jgi:hypothetical protein
MPPLAGRRRTRRKAPISAPVLAASFGEAPVRARTVFVGIDVFVLARLVRRF